MEDITYIKIYRKSLNSEIFLELPFDKWHAFMWLLLKARRFPTVCILKGQKIELNQGQLICGIETMAKEWGWSENKVRRFLKLLKSLEMIQADGTPNGTLITIENYAFYQGIEQNSDRPNERTGETANSIPNESLDERTFDGLEGQTGGTPDKPKNGTPTDTLANVENCTFQQDGEQNDGRPENRIDGTRIKNDNKNIYIGQFEECWKVYPRKLGKSEAYKKYVKARKEGVPHEEILDGVKKYAIYVKDKDKEYIKYGSTWFNQRCWEDEYESQERKIYG